MENLIGVCLCGMILSGCLLIFATQNIFFLRKDIADLYKQNIDIKVKISSLEREIQKKRW